MSAIPAAILEHLKSIEPGASFKYSAPQVTSSSGATYYVKQGSSSEIEQYTGEVDSLKAIGAAAPGLAPKVLASGVSSDSGKPYFISEYKHLNGLGSGAQALAERLAKEMHQYKSPEGGFGFQVPTFCGATRQKNGWYDTWAECYGEMIGDLLHGLRQQGRSNKELCDKGDEVRQKVIPWLLEPLDIESVLCHGDLWSGNVGIDSKTQQPIIFDPSSFYGHNEADLAIARIFGGFSPSFFETYHEHLPKTEPVDQYELRVALYELYHYLNHALLFGGGGYSRSAVDRMNLLLRAYNSSH